MLCTFSAAYAVGSSRTAAPIMGATGGIMSWFSSANGVVFPTLIPTVPEIAEQVGGASIVQIAEGQVNPSGNGGPGYISHPHQVCLDPSGKWLLVPSQGRLQGVGKITVFRVDAEAGDLIESFAIKGRSGAEPRHCVFHPNGRFCYCLNEKDSTAACYYFNEENGTLALQQILTTLPETYPGDGWASAIEIGADGRILYLSNRKHDSVTVFGLDQETGHMTYLQNVGTKGEQPRFITINPEGTQLLAANELTDTICCMDIDPETGMLSYSGKEIPAESPVCVIFRTVE